MSYRIYSTKGFLLWSTPSGETSKTYLIYTEDFGLIRARAQGVRLLASKLRYSLTDYSFLSLSLVRGKEFWRITGAAPETPVALATTGSDAAPSRAMQNARARIFSLTKRLVQGEEKNDRLFAALSGLFESEVPAEDMQAFESLILARALSVLGYLDIERLVPDNSLATAKANIKSIVPAINKALQESQL
ncbi:MAG: recombination protein O N-terminal domain-containing protein [bacterium]|nr:recombination protein O N-terminal domain-containing protein [bacterium]